MKNIFLFAFVFGAVVFTSIQAKEEVAKVKASQQISIDSYKNTTDIYKNSAISNMVEDENVID